MFLKKVYVARNNVKPVRDEVINGLALNARKHGADIIKCEYGDDWFVYLEKNIATAFCLSTDAIIFRPDVTVSEVLEETRHFEQNISGLNNNAPILRLFSTKLMQSSMYWITQKSILYRILK